MNIYKNSFKFFQISKILRHFLRDLIVPLPNIITFMLKTEFKCKRISLCKFTDTTNVGSILKKFSKLAQRNGREILFEI